MQNLSMNSMLGHQFIWSMAMGLDLKASWYQTEDRAWMSDTYIVGQVPDDSQKEPQTQYGSESVQLSLQPRGDTDTGWHRLTEKIPNLLVWMDHVDMKKS